NSLASSVVARMSEAICRSAFPGFRRRAECATASSGLLATGARLARLVTQIEPDMELAQLPWRDFRWRAHHQVLGTLIHRKQHDFPQVLLPAQKHHDPVNPGGDPPVGWRTQQQGVQHAAEFLL